MPRMNPGCTLLHLLMKVDGVGVTELAKRANVSGGTISNAATTVTKPRAISDEMMQRIADAVGLESDPQMLRWRIVRDGDRLRLERP